jgi:type IV secretion system protein VirB11
MMDERYKRQLEVAAGALILDGLRNPKVIEIMLNPDGVLWFDVMGEGMQVVGNIQSSHATQFLNLVAAGLETTVNADKPILEGELPLDGSRIEGVLPPLVASPSFAIRKKATSIFTLDQYVENGIMSAQQREYIIDAVTKRKNILIAGSTGSGKTTLSNAVLAEIAAQAGNEQRIVMIEDTVELQCSAPNVVALRTSKTTSMQDLLKVTMRMRPDRIVVGEVRGGEALSLLKAWNTGHPGGVATLHANNASAALIRLGQLIAEATTAPQHYLIAEAVNVVIFIAKTETGRKIKEVIEVDGYDNDSYIVNKI